MYVRFFFRFSFLLPFVKVRAYKAFCNSHYWRPVHKDKSSEDEHSISERLLFYIATLWLFFFRYWALVLHKNFMTNLQRKLNCWKERSITMLASLLYVDLLAWCTSLYHRHFTWSCVFVLKYDPRQWHQRAESRHAICELFATEQSLYNFSKGKIWAHWFHVSAKYIDGFYWFLPMQDYGTLMCWGGNDIGAQVEPCIFMVNPAGNVIIFFFVMHASFLLWIR